MYLPYATEIKAEIRSKDAKPKLTLKLYSIRAGSPIFVIRKILQNCGTLWQNVAKACVGKI